MSSQKHIYDELRSLDSTLPVPDNNPVYSVPEGYFNGLADRILAKVKQPEHSVQTELESLSPLLAGIPKQMPYSVPSFYFDETLAGVSAAPTEPTSPVLEAISKTTPYQVPKGYFETLPPQIIAAVQPKGKVVPLFARSWMKMASAAAVIGAIIFGGFQLLSNNAADERNGMADGTAITPPQQQVASNNQPILKEIKKASTKELEAFIATVRPATTKAAVTTATQPETKKLEAEELLKDVSISEMESFLSAIPTMDEDVMITD